MPNLSRIARMLWREGSSDPTVVRVGRDRRIDVPGWHHVTCRTVDGVDALADDDDKRLLERQVLIVVRRFDWTCAAYCWMSNHYHVLVRIPDATLSRGMHRLNSVFANKYNEIRDRTGHVFGSRFHTALVQSQLHLLRTFRYIERNPVRAGVVPRPVGWPVE